MIMAQSEVDSQQQSNQFEPIHNIFPIMEQVFPYVRSDVHEIAGHKHQRILLRSRRKTMWVEAHPYTHQRYQVYYSITEYGLVCTESALKQNSHVSHLSGYLMCDDSESDRQELVWIAEVESYANSKPIYKIMKERTYEVEIARSLLGNTVIF